MAVRPECRRQARAERGGDWAPQEGVNHPIDAPAQRARAWLLRPRPPCVAAGVCALCGLALVELLEEPEVLGPERAEDADQGRVVGAAGFAAGCSGT